MSANVAYLSAAVGLKGASSYIKFPFVGVKAYEPAATTIDDLTKILQRLRWLSVNTSATSFSDRTMLGLQNDHFS